MNQKQTVTNLQYLAKKIPDVKYSQDFFQLLRDFYFTENL